MSPLNFFATILREFNESFVEIKELFKLMQKQPKYHNLNYN
jgi:hypothetical protein